MSEPQIYEKVMAIDFLCDMFSMKPAEEDHTIALIGLDGAETSTEISAKITIAGFSEKERKKKGRLDPLVDKTGAVFLYGTIYPDYFMILKYEGKTTILQLNDAVVKKTGFAGSLLHISSQSWEKLEAVELTIGSMLAGDAALKMFSQTLLPKINNSVYAARVGKWVSKKVFDRNLGKDKEDRLAIEAALKNPEKEYIRTMSIGNDVQNFLLNHGDTDKEISHNLIAIQKMGKTKIPFREMIIETNTMGKEIGAKQSLSTYIYLIGTTFQAPSNLIIIRHRGSEE